MKALAVITVSTCVGMLLSACGDPASAPAQATPPQYGATPEALERVINACDQFGNRIYKSTGGPGVPAIAVVGADPTCRSVSR